MNPVAVVSTMLLTVAYDPDCEQLELEFCDHAVYRYFNVPATIHQGLMDAPSKGGYFNRAIRGRFDYVRETALLS